MIFLACMGVFLSVVVSHAQNSVLSGQTSTTCTAKQLQDAEGRLADVVVVLPGQTFAEAYNQMYGCSFDSSILREIAGARVTLPNGRLVGTIEAFATDLTGTTRYAVIRTEENADFTPLGDNPAIRFDQFASWDGTSVITGPTRLTELMIARPDQTLVDINIEQNTTLASWFDVFTGWFLPPLHFPLQVQSVPPRASVLVGNDEVGITNIRFLINQSIMDEIRVVKDGFEECRFDVTVYRWNSDLGHGQIDCILSETH